MYFTSQSFYLMMTNIVILYIAVAYELQQINSELLSYLNFLSSGKSAVSNLSHS